MNIVVMLRAKTQHIITLTQHNTCNTLAPLLQDGSYLAELLIEKGYEVGLLSLLDQ